MPENRLDCKGLACPHPVLRTKDVLEKNAPASLQVVVDNEAAKQNVTRFLQGKGYAVQAEAQGSDWVLTAQLDSGAPAPAPRAAAPASAEPATGARKIVVFITSDCIGRGSDELGAKLMGNFLATLPELGRELWRIVMVNAGVKLAIDGSPALDALRKLENDGADILVCGTCLDFFGVLDKRQVGATTNMLDVVTSLQLADRVIQV